MPVPTLLTDLSATIASNSPAGSDNVFPDLDNYLRALSGFLASIRDNSGNGWVSPYLTAANPSYTGTLTGGTGIVNLGSGQFYKDAAGQVGIGTSSPHYRLNISGAQQNIGGGANTIPALATTLVSGEINGSLNNSTDYGLLRLSAGGRGGVLVTKTAIDLQGHGTTDNSQIRLYTAGTQRMLLDSSGNLGLGVTPSAWSTNERAVQIGTTLSLIRGSSSEAILAYNTYINSVGSYIYNITANSSRYEQLAGQHKWYTAPSGTAGNAISFTQAMTLHASGGLSVGTTSDPGANNIGLAAGGKLYYSTNAWITPEDNVIGARISGSAVVGFWTGGAERARITSGGDLLVGSTGGGLQNSYSTNFTQASGYWTVNHANASPDTRRYFYFGYNGSEIGSITQSGTTAVAYNTSSDYRLKDNPQPLTGSGAFIDALQPKTWDWKADGSRGVGFLAHEAQAVSPRSVVGEKDAVDEDGKPIMQAMEYGSAEFIANIIAELKSLRARVATLEA